MKLIGQYFIGLLLFTTGCKTRMGEERQAVRTSDNCTYGIWQHVYNPERLKILDTCKVVRGVIVESNEEDDGDEHMLLKLDDGQGNLLTPGNMTSKRRCLVIEAICVNNITKNKVGNSCEGYVNNIELPKLNDHVEVTGSYVIDSHNGWAEIHPISKLEIIK